MLLLDVRRWKIGKNAGRKKKISDKWKSFDESNINFIQGIKGTIPNFWLNAICLESKNERDFSWNIQIKIM